MPSVTEPVDPATLTACPTCGDDVVNVQGIYTCSNCRWVAPRSR